MKTAVLTDSGSAMAIQQAQEHGIFLLSLRVIDEEHLYRGGADISTEELYEVLRKWHTPKMNMPVDNVIEATPRTIKKQGCEEIVSVPLSSGLSSIFNTVQVMTREIGIPIVHIEDSTTCDLQGHETLLAERYTDEGKSGAEISELLSKLIRTGGTSILSNDIQHLERGGRLIPLAAAAASLLKAKPVFIIDPSTRGKIGVLEKVCTKKKAAVHAVGTTSEKPAGREGYVYAIHPDCLGKAEDIHRQLLERSNRLEIRIDTISAVIAAHTGLDCITIQYIEK